VPEPSSDGGTGWRGRSRRRSQKLQGYLHALILKMKAAHSRCEACKVRQATVRVTEIHNGSTTIRHLCDLCARERGDVFV
jgi:hypothetical protein